LSHRTFAARTDGRDTNRLFPVLLLIEIVSITAGSLQVDVLYISANDLCFRGD